MKFKMNMNMKEQVVAFYIYIKKPIYMIYIYICINCLLKMFFKHFNICVCVCVFYRIGLLRQKIV